MEESKWTKVWESSLDGEYSAVISAASTSPPAFSLMLKRFFNNWTSVICLSRTEAAWLVANMKEAQACSYSTTSSAGEVLRKIEVSTIVTKGFIIHKILSIRKDKNNLSLFVPSWKLDAFIFLVAEAVNRLNQLS